MDNFNGFIKDYIQGRVDGLLNQLATEFRKEYEQIALLKDGLYASLSPQQRALLDSYCDALNSNFAQVLDEMYRQGVTDGLNLINILKGGNKDD